MFCKNNERNAAKNQEDTRNCRKQSGVSKWCLQKKICPFHFNEKHVCGEKKGEFLDRKKQYLTDVLSSRRALNFFKNILMFFRQLSLSNTFLSISPPPHVFWNFFWSLCRLFVADFFPALLKLFSTILSLFFKCSFINYFLQMLANWKIILL